LTQSGASFGHNASAGAHAQPSTFLYDCAFTITKTLEITPDDVALLSDTDLRTLVGLLCESELRSRELSSAAVTWSGHQNSADGGLDVRVALAEGETIEGFVPARRLAFR